MVVRSLNNNGNDYILPFAQDIFDATLVNNSLGQVSNNRLITTPSGNVNVNIGDRLVLIIQAEGISEATQVTVSVSVQLTPSGI